MHESSELVAAVKAAKGCKKIIYKYFATGITYNKKSAQELVTKADFECERTIKRVLSMRFPQYGFCGEETSPARLKDNCFWIVDPIDGTTNFVHGIPAFVVSISLIKNGEPIVGVIFDPIHDQLFQAEKGKGAYLNGKRITVSNTLNLQDAVVQFNAGYNNRSTAGKLIAKIGDKIRGPQMGRSTALQMADVCCGRSDAFTKIKLNPFDLPAGLLLIKEAGGKITNLQGNQFILYKDRDIVASNGKIHSLLIKEIKATAPKEE